MYITPTQPPYIANTKMVVGRQIVNETTMFQGTCNLFILRSNPTTVYLRKYVGPLNSIKFYVMYCTHGCFNIMELLKRTHVDISVAEALVYGPILIKIFI